MGLSTSEAHLLALMLTCILYGLNIITFFLSLQRLSRGRDSLGKHASGRGTHFSLMTTVVILLFISSTTIAGLELALVMRGYAYLLKSRPANIRTERRAIILSQAVLAIFQTLIADSVLLFRCWTIWNKMILAIVLPLVLWVGCLSSSVYAIYCLYFRLFWQPPNPITAKESLYPTYATFWTCTIILNIYCTGMIDLPQRTRFQLAKRIVIESAMMYTASSLCVFITHASSSPAATIAYLVEVQIVGIAFNLILIRRSSPMQDRESDLCVRCFNPKTNRSIVDAAVGTTESVNVL